MEKPVFNYDEASDTLYKMAVLLMPAEGPREIRMVSQWCAASISMVESAFSALT